MDGVKPIPEKLYFRIGDVSEIVGVKPYVLRYWESEFPMISPEKSASNQRVYRRVDVETVILIKKLLYEERYSIEGARKKIRELKREGGLKSLRKAVSEGSSVVATSEALESEASAGQGSGDAHAGPLPSEVSAAMNEAGERSQSGSLRLRTLALELSLLAHRPITDFFR